PAPPPPRPPGPASTAVRIPSPPASCQLTAGPAPARSATTPLATPRSSPGPAGGTFGFCLESTGTYGTALATARAGAGRHVSVVNPARIKYAGLMRRQGNKTDTADARLIAEDAQRQPPPAPP